MDGYSSLSEFGESFARHLQSGLDEAFDDRVIVTLDAPHKIQDDNKADTRLLSFFIYSVVENTTHRNSLPALDDKYGFNRTIAHDAYFVCTPYGPDSGSILRLWGRTQQILQNSAIFKPPFANVGEGLERTIKIEQQSFPQELMVRLWQAMGSSMRLALYYFAGPIIIDIPVLGPAMPIEKRRRNRDELDAYLLLP
jgi:hypothetical protein